MPNITKGQTSPPHPTLAEAALKRVLRRYERGSEATKLALVPMLAGLCRQLLYLREQDRALLDYARHAHAQARANGRKGAAKRWGKQNG